MCEVTSKCCHPTFTSCRMCLTLQCLQDMFLFHQISIQGQYRCSLIENNLIWDLHFTMTRFVWMELDLQKAEDELIFLLVIILGRFSQSNEDGEPDPATLFSSRRADSILFGLVLADLLVIIGKMCIVLRKSLGNWLLNLEQQLNKPSHYYWFRPSLSLPRLLTMAVWLWTTWTYNDSKQKKQHLITSFI